MMRIGALMPLLDLTDEGVKVRRDTAKRVFADHLRENQTASERMMARVLFHLGIDAKPQVVLLGWIVDFFDADHLTVIEVDGSSHNGREAEDRMRDESLERAGYRVLHFHNEEVRHIMANLALDREAA